MAELNLKQIADKLNNEFTGEVRKLVFWYDDNAEFADDVDSMELINAKVLHLEKDNQFYTKYFLECVDTETNYLVYAPFPRPSIRENHLEDTIKYSKEFVADRISIIMLDLMIKPQYKGILQKHKAFFADKKRRQAFYDLEVESHNQETIEVGIMSAICKLKVPSFDEVLRVVVCESIDEDNKFLAEFAKYDLTEVFWNYVESGFGYIDNKPTLEKLMMTMFVSYLSKDIKEIPAAWSHFVSFKAGSIATFFDNLMNSIVYGKRFDEISERVFVSLNGSAEIAKMPIELVEQCGIFAGVERKIVDWIIERLELEDVSAKIGNKDIPQVVKEHRQSHFGKKYRSEYLVLENAWYIISNSKYQHISDINSLIQKYVDELYKIDRRYRYFYYYFDKLENYTRFEKLKELVENIYANEYLEKVCLNWNECFANQIGSMSIKKQTDFYDENVEYAKEQLVVIISDALRYEVGASLFEKLQANEKCDATIVPMLSTLPSITQYGMAALLPHKHIDLGEDFSITVDEKKMSTLEHRQNILRKYKSSSRCVQYDEIKNLSTAELRAVFGKQDVVYVYHNQVDARGDKFATENEVFNACEEAIDEISSFIRKLTVNANKSHFIVTSDHGFIYKRNKLRENDKISAIVDNKKTVAKRFILSNEDISFEGVKTFNLSDVIGIKDERMVTVPIGSEVFKAPGAGVNYVHGGSSLQEMIIPFINVKTEKGYKETNTVQINLVSLTTKLTNKIADFDFVQTEPISDVVKETTFRILFVTEDEEKISNEHLYVADNKEIDSVKRIFKLRFNLKDRKYDRSQKYYLVAYDNNTNLEVLRKQIVIDIAFADDFGFGF